MSEGISIRLKEQWDAHPDSTVTVLCACGASFSEHGPSDDVQQKARAFLRSHNCPIRTIEGDVILYNVQRTDGVGE